MDPQDNTHDQQRVDTEARGLSFYTPSYISGPYPQRQGNSREKQAEGSEPHFHQASEFEWTSLQ